MEGELPRGQGRHVSIVKSTPANLGRAKKKGKAAAALP